MLRVFVAAIVALLVALPVAEVRAETEAQRRTAEAARAWGLLGAWRLDCNDPKASSLDYVIRDGVLLHERDLSNTKDVQEVLEAKPLPDGRLELVVHFPSFKQTRRYAVMRDGERLRAMSNTLREGGDATILNGRFVHNGQETPWQSRCNPGTAAGTPDDTVSTAGGAGGADRQVDKD
jgi:hypothetical protein